MKKRKDSFDQWFQEQFGGLPDPERLLDLRQESYELAYKLAVAKGLAGELELLRDQYTAAKYATNRTKEKSRG